MFESKHNDDSFGVGSASKIAHDFLAIFLGLEGVLHHVAYQR